jgi:hypothetical protein
MLDYLYRKSDRVVSMQHRNLKQYPNASKKFDTRITNTIFDEMRTARNIAIVKKAYPKAGTVRIGRKAA